VPAPPRRARDLGLVDALAAFERAPFAAEVWRVTRAGRDPTEPSRSKGRWSDGSFSVLYTSLEREVAQAEIFALLSLQPVIPSRNSWLAHKLRVNARGSLNLSSFDVLKRLGVDPSRYEARDYSITQPVGETASFLEADGLLVRSARAAGKNFVAFVDRLAESDIELVETLPEPIDWDAWRRARRT